MSTVGPVGTGSASSQAPMPTPPDYYTAEQNLEFYLAIQQGRKPPNIPRPRSASASAAPQQFDISDEGQPEVAT